MTCYTHYEVVNMSQNFKCSSLFVLCYHWLPLATIDLVGDYREFEDLRHILSGYTHYRYLIVSEHERCITYLSMVTIGCP